MSKIVKKKQLDVLIESTLKEAGIETKKVAPKKEVVKESRSRKKVLTEGAVIDKIKEIIKQIVS